jgi:hypothetical protein
MDFILKDIEVDIAGKSNPASLKKDIFFTTIDQITTIPPLDADSNQISAPLGMRLPIAPNAAAMPPIAEVKAGKFAKISASELDLDFKVDRVGEGDNHAGFKVMVKAFINGKTARASFLLAQLRNRRLALVVTEKDGTHYFIHDIILHYGSQVNPKRGYALEGDVILSEEPPVIISPLVF